MIIMIFFLLSIAVLGIVVYKYLHHEQDKFIPNDKYDEAWNEFFKNAPPKKVVFTRKNNVIGYIFRKISGNILVSFFLGFILTIVFIYFCGYVILGIIFSGGINGLISNLMPAPNPNSWTMNAKREKATEEINQSFDELQNIFGYNYYETAKHDYCSRGNSSWKRSDGYAYRCSLRITKFYGFNGDFRQQVIDFEQKISSINWKPHYSYDPDKTCEKMLERRYDPYPGILVSNLPTLDCRYQKDKPLLELELEFAEKETNSFFEFDFIQAVSGHTLWDIYSEANFQDSSLVIKKITNTNKFVLVISIQRDYFQN